MAAVPSGLPSVLTMQKGSFLALKLEDCCHHFKKTDCYEKAARCIKMQRSQQYNTFLNPGNSLTLYYFLLELITIEMDTSVCNMKLPHKGLY